MSGRKLASEEERWESLRGKDVEVVVPDGWEPDEGEDFNATENEKTCSTSA